MYQELLEMLGLSKNEARVYRALLSIGMTTTGPLVKASGVPSSKMYTILDSLVSKGIAGYVLKGKMKRFSVNSPDSLLQLLDKKEAEVTAAKVELEKRLPTLKAEFTKDQQEYRVEVFEGLRGIKSIYDLAFDATTNKDAMFTIGYPLLASTLLNAYFKAYHKKIARKGQPVRVIYDHDTWFAKKREARPHAEQRYLPRGIHTPGFVHIFLDYVAIMVVTENQKTAILIKNKEVADSYRQYFGLLWEVARIPTQAQHRLRDGQNR